MLGKRLINTTSGSGGTTCVLDILGDNSCVATYQLNGNANDVGGNYNGSISGTIPFVTGQFGQAAQIGPSNDYINTTINPSSFTVATVSCWFKRNGTPTNSRHMIWGGATSTTIFGLVEVGSSIYIGNNTGATAFSKTDFTNYWQHIVIAATSSSCTTYLNGQLADNLSHSLPFLNSTSSFIGRSSYGNYHQMNGDLDQVRIFNKALSAAEVTTLYNETACN